MDDLELVPIDQDGVPRDRPGPLTTVVKDVCTSAVALYDAVGFDEPWIVYLCALGSELVGTCGFKSAPANGRVEIAYFTFPEFEGRGLASAMASTLVDITGRERPDVTVIAQTVPRPGASTRILEKLGFRHVGTFDHTTDGEIWEWHRRSDADAGP